MTHQADSTTTRWGKVPVWWQQMPGMDLDRWGVLTTLSLYADENGVCFPSQATIARGLKRSRPWVNRVIGDLAKAGLIRKTSRTRAGNAGTTSCEYRLVTDRSEVDGQICAVPTVTPACHDDDMACPPGDRTQLESEQNIPARPEARDPTNTHRIETQSGIEREAVPPDWEPSPATMEKARALMPEEDLAAHAIMFASRCKANGYQYVRGQVDEAWLGWLAEDRLKQHKKGREGPKDRGTGSLGMLQDHKERRFAAWAAAAAAPRLKTTTPACTEPELANPWR
jgi:hypothetical protein